MGWGYLSTDKSENVIYITQIEQGHMTVLACHFDKRHLENPANIVITVCNKNTFIFQMKKSPWF